MNEELIKKVLGLAEVRSVDQTGVPKGFTRANGNEDATKLRTALIDILNDKGTNKNNVLTVSMILANLLGNAIGMTLASGFPDDTLEQLVNANIVNGLEEFKASNKEAANAH